MTANNESSNNNGQEEYLKIVEQNNLGVVHLMNGNLNDANRCLRSAFEMVRKRVLLNRQNKNKITSSSSASQQQQQQQQRQRRTQQHESVYTSLRQQNMNSSITKQSSSELNQQRKQYIDILKATATMNYGNNNNNNRNCCSATTATTTTKGFMIYSSAFVNNEDNADNQIQWCIVSAYIVFNLGLLFYAHAQQQSSQLQQQQQGQRRCDSLQNAMKMFENALKLLVDQNFQNHNNISSPLSSSVFLKRSTGNPLIDLFYMTLLSKLGQVHYDLLLTRKAHHFQYELSKMVHQFLSFPSQSSFDDNVHIWDTQQQHMLVLPQQHQRSPSSRCTNNRFLCSNKDMELKYLLRVNGMNLLLELDNHIMMNNNNNRQQHQPQAQEVVSDHSSSTVATFTLSTPSNDGHGAPAA